jgi:hypothetical protein
METSTKPVDWQSEPLENKPSPIKKTFSIEGTSQLDSQLPPYEYIALPHPDSIRLVTVSSIHPTIECETKFVRLSEFPSYEAPSYRWGPPGITVPISCDGQSFYVSATLRDGLRQLYRYGKSSETVWLWIDQICINQEDGIERTQQVRLMNKIYRQGIRTVIWLPLDEETALAAKLLILDMSFYLEVKTREDDKQSGGGVATTEADDFFDAVVADPSLMDRWRALIRLFASPWFERVWVIQEVALSTCAPIILCNTQLIPWLDVQRIVHGMMAHRDSRVGSVPRAYLANDMCIIGRRVIWADRTDDITWDIQSLLILTRLFLATNPRDRIYALLGLCKETRHLEKWPKELDPDYNRSLSELFTSVTKFCIRQTKTLDIFSIVYGTSTVQDKGFPSWVPRYDIDMEKRAETGSYRVHEHVDHRSIAYNSHNASRGIELMVDHTTRPGVLRLSGMRLGSPVLFGSTVWSAKYLSIKGTESKWFRQEVTGALEACRENLPRLSTAELHRAFFMVTTKGKTLEWTDAEDEPLMHFKAYMGIEEEPSLADLETQMESTHCTFDSNLSLEPDAERYARITASIFERRFFKIGSGLLGLGPDDMLGSDIVVILFGGKVPCVLRPLDNGQWLFVGECYVYGLMKGEALKGDRANAKNHEWFELV